MNKKIPALPTALLAFGDHHLELPILSPTLGNNVIDVRTVRKSDVFTFDPGFMATASCESKITFIDGENGILLYRGYPIEQLAEHKTYTEVAYLLLYGELPSGAEHNAFREDLLAQAVIPEELYAILEGFQADAPMMAVLLSLVGGLAGHYHHAIDITRRDDRLQAAHHLIAKMPILSAMCYRHAHGLPLIVPQAELGYAQNFLHMVFGDDEGKASNNVLVRAMDRIFTLHADHEQNASTSTMRLAGSTGTDPFAAIAAGIAALWGPAHGGANEAALNMLREIGSEDRIEHYLEKAKDKDDPFRLMGFGHRVYKNYDPRAKIMRQTCHDVLDECGVHDDPLLKVALKLEKIALEDAYFIERKLYPNVDFYSGITLNAMGIPSTLFTVIFALARTSGWVAHWHEMLSDPDLRIGRPRQLYTGADRRDI